MEVMNAVAVAIVLGGVSANAAQILTHINPWQKAGCIPELIKVISHHPRHSLRWPDRTVYNYLGSVSRYYVCIGGGAGSWKKRT